MSTFTLNLSPRRHTLDVDLSPRRHEHALALSARRPEVALTTAFTTNPTGRVFNARFSDRFKKS